MSGQSYAVSLAVLINIISALLFISLFTLVPSVIGQQPSDSIAVDYGMPGNLAMGADKARIMPGPGNWTAMPPNPEFIEYQQELLSGNLSTGNRTHGLGYIPSPVKLAQGNTGKKMLASFRQMASYPAVYDLRTLGRVTPVRNQGSAGTCWAFATYGSLESYLMPSESRDFSENNLKNNAGFDMDVNNGGGNIDMATAYLTRWAGPVDETADPYNVSTNSSPSGLTVQKHVQDVLYMPQYDGPSDSGNIKSALMNYGAVWAFMAWGDAYYNSAYRSYYYNQDHIHNGHAVTIVGWDDNFDLNKFNEGNRPPGNGAFIVKNSWGTSWGESGYFYVSYYDSIFADACAVFLSEPADNYDNIYQYDPLGWTVTLQLNKSVAWFANLFTAQSDEMISAVGFYVPEENNIFDVYVFDDNSLIASKTGIVNPPMGYHTFPLDTPAALQAGHYFSVRVRVDSPEYALICLEMPFANYTSNAIAKPSEGFKSADGVSWSDINEQFPGTSICLKAYTSEIQELEFSPVTCNVNKNAGTATLTIKKTGASGQNPLVSYSTADGTALAGIDYMAKSGQVTFLPSEMTKTITIDILDAQGFDNRQFFVNLSAPVNAVIDAGASATITILNSHKPVQTVLAPAMVPGYLGTGGISGRVTNPNTTIGIASAYVAIVNAFNTSQAYYEGQAHPDGTFEFTNINNTYTVSGYQSKYRLYANHSLFGEGFSDNFTVYEGATTAVNAVINMLPAHIALVPDNSSIVANASDNVTVSAYVTDLLNGPVVNGFAVTFSLNDTTAGSGLFRPESSNTPAGNTITVTTVNGYAKARFGWATRNGAINIRAAWTGDNSIYATSVETVLQSPPPAIGFSPASLTANENAGTITVTLQKNGYADADSSVSYSTGGGNATAGANYGTASGTFVFHPSDTVKTFTVPILDDGVYGRQKVFYVSLSGPVNAGLTTASLPVYINNVDSAPILYFDVASASVYDNAGSVTVNVTKTGNTELNARVDYLTLNDTAGAGLDFTNASGTLTFAPGETKKTVTITILPDITYEDDETFNVLLRDPLNATLNTSKTAIVGITSSIPHNEIINLVRGWNLVTIPVNNNTLKASDLINNSSLGVDMVSFYNHSAGSYTTYYSGATSWKNMQLTPDCGYFIHGTKNSSFNVNGTTVQGHYISIYHGWNLIAWNSYSTIKASDLFGRATLSMASRYDRNTGIYQTYYQGASSAKNFSLIEGEGYFLRSDISAVQQLYVG